MMKMTLNEEIEYLKSGNWYDKVRAVLPTDEYLKLGWAIGDILETLELFRSLAPEPQTNADHIRAMSDDELAIWLCGKMDCSICKRNIQSDGECDNYSKDGVSVSILNWLQSQAEEST